MAVSGGQHHHNQHVKWAPDTNGRGDRRSESTEQLDRLLKGLDELTGTLPDISRPDFGSRSNSVGRDVVNTSFTTDLQSDLSSNNFGNAREVNVGRSPLHVQRSSSLATRGQYGGGPSLTAAQQKAVASYEDDLDYALERELMGSTNTDYRASSSLANESLGGLDDGNLNDDNSVHSETDLNGMMAGLLGSNRPLIGASNGSVTNVGDRMTSVKGPERRPLVNVENYGKVYTGEEDREDRGHGPPGGVQAPEQPYHTRCDSKPFSYIRQNPSPSLSRNLSRAGSREAGLDSGARSRGLESPALLRRVMGGSQGQDDGSPLGTPRRGSPAPMNGVSNGGSPVHVAIMNNGARFSPGPSNFSLTGRSGGQDLANRTQSQFYQQSSYSQSQQVTKTMMTSSSMTSRHEMVQQQHGGANNHQQMLESNHHTNGNAIQDLTSFQLERTESPALLDPLAPSSGGLRTEEERESWLQIQQRKLQERRQGVKTSNKESNHVIQELKTSINRARSGYAETTDGYVSDVNSFNLSETSRESSPAKFTQGYTTQPQMRPGFDEVDRQQQHYHINSADLQQQHHINSSDIYSTVNKRQPYTHNTGISRQKSDTSFDRNARPVIARKLRHDSEGDHDNDIYRNGDHLRNLSNNSIDSLGFTFNASLSRPVTPGFPVSSTPYFNQSTATLPPKSPGITRIQGTYNTVRSELSSSRAPSPAGSFYQGDPNLMTSSRRGSVSSEPAEVPASNVKLVKDNYKFWYKKHISREEAIAILKEQPPGTFIVRDSNSFPGAFGLALKVSTPPQNSKVDPKDPSSELVRHFLIEPTTKGVKLKGYNNEPVFASLSALIYQHTILPLALPTRLVLPQHDLGGGGLEQSGPSAEMAQLLQFGAACNVYYLLTVDTDQLTGPQAVKGTVSQLFLTRPVPSPTVVNFKVSGQGITLTDQARKLFFRKHFPVATISHCGVDPEDRRWSLKTSEGVTDQSMRLFAFVARKTGAGNICNQCHVFSELDPDQPARAIVNFVNKLMLSGSSISHGKHVDIV